MKLSRPKNNSMWLSIAFEPPNGIGTQHRRYQYATCMAITVPSVAKSSVRKYGSWVPGLSANCLKSGNSRQTTKKAPTIWIANRSK